MRGGTKLTFALWWEPTGLKKLFMSRGVQKTMETEVGQLSRLKAVLEAGG